MELLMEAGCVGGCIPASHILYLQCAVGLAVFQRRSFGISGTRFFPSWMSFLSPSVKALRKFISDKKSTSRGIQRSQTFAKTSDSPFLQSGNSKKSYYPAMIKILYLHYEPECHQNLIRCCQSHSPSKKNSSTTF